MSLRLYTYWRSSAAYRVRIALNYKRLEWESIPTHLLRGGGEHLAPAYLARNPQGLVPALEDGEYLLAQSLAIIEYLDETRPGSDLLPAHPIERARVRALSYAVAMDIHPVCNTGPVNYVMALSGRGEAVRVGWMQKFIGDGLAALETLLDHPATGRFCHGDSPTMADLCLVPQVYNAKRWQADIAALDRINAIAAACAELPAFQAAYPTDPKGVAG
jgi:maleylacetoacetate isomerase